MTNRTVRFAQEGLADRVRRFIAAFQDLDDGDDVAIYSGAALTGDDEREAALIVEFDDDKLFGFTCEQARLVAKLAEDISSGHDCNTPGCCYRGFRGLIAALREGADEAEREFNQERTLH